ncbi:MAG: hypothetical protein KKH94_11345 [Candidatus Omnitrophica bacterium]|nr:hypothetical protein [Candidatus Omnitrophota bacterium]
MAKVSGEVKVVYSAEDKATAVGKNVQGGLKTTGKASDSVSERMKKQWLSVANVMKVAVVAAAIMMARKVVQAFKEMFTSSFQAGLEIDKFAKQTGLAADQIQKLQYAAKQEHLEVESLSKIFPILTKYMAYAGEGMLTYKREFDKMGISVLDAKGKLKTTYDVFMEMSTFMAGNGASDTEKLAIAMALLGRRGAEAMPFMKLGRQYLEEMGIEAEKTGAILSGDTVIGMKLVADKITFIQEAVRGFGRRMVTEMLPLINAIVGWVKANAPELADIGTSLGRGLSDLITWSGAHFFPFFIRSWNFSKLAVQGVLWGILKLQEAQIKLREITSFGLVKMLPGWQEQKDFVAFNLEQLQKQMNATLDADEKLTQLQKSFIEFNSNSKKSLDEAIAKIKELKAALPPDEENVRNEEKWLKLLDSEKKVCEEILKLNKELRSIQKEFYSDTWRLMMDSANLAGDDLGKFGGMAMSGFKGMSDVAMGYDPYSAQMEQLTNFYQQRIETIQEQFQVIRDMMIENNQTELEMEKAKQFELYAIKQEGLARDLQMTGLMQAQKLDMYQNNVNMTMGILGMLATFADDNSKALFAIEKAAAVASIIINAHKAAALALATIPPPVGQALASKYLAWGYAMAAATAAMAIKQMTQPAVSAGGGVAAAGGYSYSEPQTPQWEEEGGGSRTINVYVYGSIVDHDKFARELIPSLDKAWGDGAS